MTEQMPQERLASGTESEAARPMVTALDIFLVFTQISLSGFGGVLFRAHEWANREQTLKSYELFARYVMPHFTGLNVQRQASMDWVAANRDAFMGAGRAAKEKATRDYAAEKGRGKA